MIKMVAIRSFYKFYGITEKITNRKKYQTKKYLIQKIPHKLHDNLNIIAS